MELAEVLHAEIMSTLYHTNVFPLDEWIAANPPEFRYGGSGLEAVRTNRASTIPQRALLAVGFLAEYGKASIEEDVGLYAAMMMTSPTDLRSFCRQYSPVLKKAGVLRGFLLELSPSMKRSYPEGFE